MAKPKKRTSSKKKKTRSSKGRPAINKNKQILIAVGIIAAVVFIAYAPVLGAGFVDIDDRKLILEKGAKFINRPFFFLKNSFQTVHYKPATFFTWVFSNRFFLCPSTVLVLINSFFAISGVVYSWQIN